MPALASNLTYIATCKEDGAVLDVSSATTKQIVFEKPDGTQITKTASFTTNGSDGKIQYKFTTAELDQAGIWRARPFVVIAGDSFPADEWKTFAVRE